VAEHGPEERTARDAAPGGFATASDEERARGARAESRTHKPAPPPRADDGPDAEADAAAQEFRDAESIGGGGG
jgi:hypothetical protein